MTLTLARRAIGLAERGIIANAWNNKCAYCKTTDGPFAIDHIVPHAASGTCDVDNLCWACSKCNAQKSDTRLPIFQEGLLLGLAGRRAKGITSKLKAAQTVVKPKVQKKAADEGLVLGNGWMFKGSVEELGRYVALADALIEHGFVEEYHGIDTWRGKPIEARFCHSIRTSKIPKSFLSERGLELRKDGYSFDFQLLFSMIQKESGPCNMGTIIDTDFCGAYSIVKFRLSLEEFLSIRNLANNACNQVRRGPVATVKKPLSEAARQLNQRGLRVLEAFLSSGLIEDRREPSYVKCNSKPLQGSFFSELGLTPRGTFDCLANLLWHSRNGLLDYNDQGAPVKDGFAFSWTPIDDADLHVFSFGKSLSELNLFTSRINQQMGVPAKPFVEVIDIPDTSFAAHLSLSQLSEAYKLLSLILSKGITEKREARWPETLPARVWFESAFVLPQGTTDAKLLLYEIAYFGKSADGWDGGSPRLVCSSIKCTETGEMQFHFIAPMKELKKLKQGIGKFLNQDKEDA